LIYGLRPFSFDGERFALITVTFISPLYIQPTCLCSMWTFSHEIGTCAVHKTRRRRLLACNDDAS
jgi:hypothetical protein